MHGLLCAGDSPPGAIKGCQRLQLAALHAEAHVLLALGAVNSISLQHRRVRQHLCVT